MHKTGQSKNTVLYFHSDPFYLIRPPAKTTIHSVLDRHGLVKRRKRRRYKAKGTPLSDTKAPNTLWCADLKGQFRLGNRKYCYPLTITDYRSRYLLACEGLESTKEDGAFPVFERAFKEFGLPGATRTDNGVSFSAPHSLYGLSRLSVWWLRLGIGIERIKPGKPQQNGRHERMHLTLKKEATKPLATTSCNNRIASISLSRYTIMNPHIRGSTACTLPNCTHLRLVNTTYPNRQSTLTTTE